MTKILLWIVLIVAVLLVLRLVNVAKAKRENARRGTAQKSQAETMIRCARCGVYVPSADAKAGPEGLICGEIGCVQKR